MPDERPEDPQQVNYRTAIMKYAIVLIALWLAMFVNPLSSKIVCKDESGNPVDWFVLYKIPRLENDPVTVFRSGFAYAFLTGPPISARELFLDNFRSSSSSKRKSSQSWKLSSHLITQEESLLGQTLGILYSQAKQPSSSFVFYNDAPPPDAGKESSNFAHAKGVHVMDSSTGFWLIHSIPLFGHPSGTGVKYSYPETGKDNGQTAICISFDTRSQVDNVLTQLLTMRPNVYGINETKDISSITDKLAQLKERKWPKQVDESVVKIKSLKGKIFASFSRNARSTKKDLYVEMIAPEIESDLLVESWRRGAGTPLPSNCSRKYKVNNVESVELSFEGGSIARTKPWSFLEDHSKWAVSTDERKHVSCIGDINRMASQYKRGGGSLCAFDQEIWNVMKTSIVGIEGCPRGKGNTPVANSDNGSKKKNKNRIGRVSSGSLRSSTTIPPYSVTGALLPVIFSWGHS